MTSSDNVIHDGIPAGDVPPADTTGTSDVPFGEPDGPSPAVPRAMIAVSRLAAHPGNVRRELDLSPEFVASIAVNGVLVALRITPDGNGFRVIDGGRRLAGALKAGVTEVPCDLVSDRAGDEPGQYLDMINMNRHRNPLTVLEEADALFAAKEAGATRTRIRKAAGLTSPALNGALAAARLSYATRSTLQDLDKQLTLDELAVLAEFDGDSDAIARLTIAASCGILEHEAELLRQARAEQAEHQRIRAELEAAGYAITEILPANGQYLTVLCQDDGNDLTPDSHAACPGRGVFFRSYDPLTPVHYCTSPGQYGHTFRHGDQSRPAAAEGTAGTPAPDDGTPHPGDTDPSRRLVIQGNREWKAAAEVRKRWLATQLFNRRTAPQEAAPFVAGQLLRMPDPLRSGLAAAHSMACFSEITGRLDRDWLEICESAPAGRLPLAMLGPIATAYEHAMTDGEGRNTWRTDRYSPCPRTEAAGYLKFLASIGYPLSGIEQAVTDLAPYTGKVPAGDPITDGPDQPGPHGPEDGPGDGPQGLGPAPDSAEGPGADGSDDTADEPETGSTDGPLTGDLEDAA
ncbi:MAG: ParB/RepB/Spo0J family partition protein [Streptosporangiaceae bacterium]